MKKIIIVIVLLFLSLSLKSQDFGIWYELDAIYSIDKVKFKLANALRINNKTKKFYIEPGVVFNFNKYFSSGLYYRRIEYYTDDETKTYNRWSFESNGHVPMDKFIWHFRYRLQEQSTGYHMEEFWVSRFRLQLDYNIKHFRPYASTELFIQMSDDTPPNKWRHIIGMEYKITQYHTPAIEYIRNDNMNILSLKYSVRF